MEQFAVSPFKVENYGLCVIEDFVPYSDTRALVSTGKSFRELNFILDVEYGFEDKLYLYGPKVMAVGEYLRLGHYDGSGGVIYSEGWEDAHQTFYHKGNKYYSNGAPNAKLYKNGEVLIDHWGEVEELGNPWILDDRIWFEAREKGTPAPEGWRIHYSDLDGKNITYFCEGANPCIYKDTLYYGIWNGSTFDIARRGVKVDELQTASMERYGEYLRYLYKRFSGYIEDSDVVMEVCTRHDRGILGREIIPHSSYIMVDRSPSRPGLTLDVLKDELPGCDVLISTAILHHTNPDNLRKLFINLGKNTRKRIILSGPNVKVLPELFGDHLYHIDVDEIIKIAIESRWVCSNIQYCGISKPLCEVMLVFMRVGP